MTTLRIALYSVDPPGLTALHTFDPESFAVIPAISDALIYIDEEGCVQPALATSWRMLSPTVMEFSLREGVRFHNGEPFDAECVVETFRAHREPTPTQAGASVFAAIKDVRATGPMTVEFETAFPDAMFLRRMFFGAIYPKGILREQGRDALAHAPVGTGAYRLVHYEPGHEILLERNPGHWAQRATVDRIRLPIVRQKEWVDMLARGELDAAWNVDSHDHVRAARLPGFEVASRDAAISQWFLLANHGPLADVRVRRALNHAVHRRLLVELTEHGFGSPQKSIATPGAEGYTELEGYRYSPELARRLLAEAGYENGFTLKGLVSETSTAVYFAVREFLSRVGVTLEADIVPRTAWLQRVAGGRHVGAPYDGDFGVIPVDNPIVHSLFHQFIFAFSQGPMSLVTSPEYDQRFLGTVTNVAEPEKAQADLERYARDEALVLFTVQQEVHAVHRRGIQMKLPRSGHFDVTAFWDLRCSFEQERPALHRPAAPASRDLEHLREATSHTGAFYLSPGVRFEDPTVERIWRNLDDAQQRWRVQNEPMLHALVDLVDAKTSLSNVLGSTDRVVIVGYSTEGKRLFANRGYEFTFGTGARSAEDDLGADAVHGWPAIRAKVDAEGSWLGPVVLSPEGRPAGAASRLFLTVTSARDDDGTRIGYTLVFNDHSGEEERIRNAATRSILDNVPYGLFVLDVEGRMKGGYSESCRAIFRERGLGELEGRELVELAGLDEREADHFRACLYQVFDDFLPTSVSLGQIPARMKIGEHTYSLHGSVIRDESEGVSGVLFTMLDISNLVAAEREAEMHRATVLVLRFRSSFESFVRDFHAELGELANGLDVPQAQARIALHTAKGVFSQFALHELSERIHDLEDADVIDTTSLQSLRARVRELVDEQRDVWDIDLDRHDAKLVVQDSLLREVEHEAALADDARVLRKIVQRTVATIRQKHVGEIVSPIAEAAEKLAERRGKHVHVSVKGKDERVPMRLVALLSSLVHLARNAVDHGLEAPEARGDKPATGSLVFDVRRDSGALLVDVFDDGRGIDTSALVAKAVERGSLSADEARGLDETQRLALIFETGLSTAEAITETSGRGVGAGAVKEIVERLGGSLAVSSKLGEGTRFSLRVPLDTGLGPMLSMPPAAAE